MHVCSTLSNKYGEARGSARVRAESGVISAEIGNMFVLKIDDLNSWVLVCIMQVSTVNMVGYLSGTATVFIICLFFRFQHYLLRRGECSGSQYSEKGLLFTPTRPYPINIYQLSIKYSQPHGILNVASYHYTIDATLISFLHICYIFQLFSIIINKILRWYYQVYRVGYHHRLKVAQKSCETSEGGQF